MTDIIFCEPKSTDYLFFDDENRLHVLVPIVAGESIALDNTCKTHFELKRFFGLIANERSAKTVLEDYLSALTYDIDLLQRIDTSDPRLLIKQQRQTQISDYIQILNDCENGTITK